MRSFSENQPCFIFYGNVRSDIKSRSLRGHLLRVNSHSIRISENNFERISVDNIVLLGSYNILYLSYYSVEFVFKYIAVIIIIGKFLSKYLLIQIFKFHEVLILKNSYFTGNKFSLKFYLQCVYILKKYLPTNDFWDFFKLKVW